MSDTTSILDLPTDPVGGGNVTNNIVMSASEPLAKPNDSTQTSGISLLYKCFNPPHTLTNRLI